MGLNTRLILACLLLTSCLPSKRKKTSDENSTPGSISLIEQKYINGDGSIYYLLSEGYAKIKVRVCNSKGECNEKVSNNKKLPLLSLSSGQYKIQAKAHNSKEGKSKWVLNKEIHITAPQEAENKNAYLFLSDQDNFIKSVDLEIIHQLEAISSQLKTCAQRSNAGAQETKTLIEALKKDLEKFKKAAPASQTLQLTEGSLKESLDPAKPSPKITNEVDAAYRERVINEIDANFKKTSDATKKPVYVIRWTKDFSFSWSPRRLMASAVDAHSGHMSLLIGDLKFKSLDGAPIFYTPEGSRYVSWPYQNDPNNDIKKHQYFEMQLVGYVDEQKFEEFDSWFKVSKYATSEMRGLALQNLLKKKVESLFVEKYKIPPPADATNPRLIANHAKSHREKFGAQWEEARIELKKILTDFDQKYRNLEYSAEFKTMGNNCTLASEKCIAKLFSDAPDHFGEEASLAPKTPQKTMQDISTSRSLGLENKTIMGQTSEFFEHFKMSKFKLTQENNPCLESLSAEHHSMLQPLLMKKNSSRFFQEFVSNLVVE